MSRFCSIGGAINPETLSQATLEEMEKKIRKFEGIEHKCLNLFFSVNHVLGLFMYYQWQDRLMIGKCKKYSD